MRAVRQSTLAKSVTLSGVGLHSGELCRVTLCPASADTGVVFRILGADGMCKSDPIAAVAASIGDTRLGTSLRGADGSEVRTIEHLMAAVAIFSLDNVLVDVEGSEVPILDGSAAPFLDAIECAGISLTGPARTALKIVLPVEVRDGERSIRATASERRVLDVSIDFPDKAIGAQSLTIDLDDLSSMRRLAGARTFCRLCDVNAMREAGLSLGGSLENAIVVDGERVLNDKPLRDPNEFALHKALDLVGDLALAGAPIIGRIEAVRPGHDLNARFLRRLMAERAAFERITLQADALRASA